MKKYYLLLLITVSCLSVSAQLQQKLNLAMQNYLKDDQFVHALNGFYVMETKTGKMIYDLNSNIGFAPASTQKIFTAIAGFELLGSDFHYSTDIYYNSGNLVIKGTADPTLGSWRFDQTKREKILNGITVALQQNGINRIEGNIIFDNSSCSYQPLPGGWIWDDIGNYYGAGSWAINWNENQYDLFLQPGTKENDPVKILGTSPVTGILFKNYLLTGKPGSGDNGYIYLAPNTTDGFVEGTIPPGKSFPISGSLPNPALQMGKELLESFRKNNISFSGYPRATFEPQEVNGITPLFSFTSPSYDSICYWFLQKSINLYGEAITKTIAIGKNKNGSTEEGVEAIKSFWKKNGIDPAALNIMDGSGLSPQNRVTPNALVTALQFARQKNWYQKFLKAMPVYNGIKMKSGTIGGTKAFAGYVTSSDGTDYTFAIISNNFSGSAGDVVQKMYKVLNVLKE